MIHWPTSFCFTLAALSAFGLSLFFRLGFGLGNFGRRVCARASFTVPAVTCGVVSAELRFQVLRRLRRGVRLVTLFRVPRLTLVLETALSSVFAPSRLIIEVAKLVLV